MIVFTKIRAFHTAVFVSLFNVFLKYLILAKRFLRISMPPHRIFGAIPPCLPHNGQESKVNSFKVMFFESKQRGSTF